MAQFSTLLPVLVLFTLCKPIVCPYVHLSYGRRDRVPYIGFSEYSTQRLGQAAGTIGSRLRKPFTNTENNVNYRRQELQVEAPQVIGPAVYNRANSAIYTTLSILDENLLRIFNVHPSQHNHRYESTTDTAVEKDIRSIFDIYIDPGTHVLDNVNRSHFNSDTDQMVGDQPDPSSSKSTHTSSDMERTEKGTNSTSLSSSTSDSNENINSNNRDIFGKRFQTPSSGGLSMTKGKVEISTQDYIRKKETGLGYIIDSKDCVEGDASSGKPYCTRLRNYPEVSHLDEIIRTKFNNLESFLGEDALMPQDLNHRIDNKQIDLCGSRTRVIYPEAGLNKNNRWHIIINTERYKQGVIVQECINEGSVFGENTGLTLPNHYKATCKQNYIYRPLVAYENGTIIKHEFKMPSCCKCVLTVS